MQAQASDWQREPFVTGVPIPCAFSCTREEFVCMQVGLIPRAMEDKWFVYYEAPFLFLHRSWTGQPVYRLRFAEHEEGVAVTEALWSTDLAQDDDSAKAYQALLVDFLVSNLLLGKHKPFPKPVGIAEPGAGAYQHHMAGTRYREQRIAIRKPWWKFW